MGLSDWVRKAGEAWAAKRRLDRDPVLQTVLTASREIFARLDVKTRIAREGQDAMARHLLDRTAEILDAADRRAECRKQVHQCVVEFARYQVINIPSAPAVDVTGLRALQGISGELEPLLMDIVKKDEHLKAAVLGELPEKNEQAIRELVILLYQRGYWFAHSMNACRIALGDYNPVPERDWFLPFVHAMCVWRESEYRRLLGLKPAIPGDNFQVVAMAYLSFANVVLGGADDPLATWRFGLRELFDNGSLQT